MSKPSEGPGITYRDAGVDIDEADRLVERIKRLTKDTHGPEVIGGIGGFASLFSLKDLIAAGAGMEDPVLVAGTDGVGTKLKVAFGTGRHDTVGIDLVAMCVNDVVTTGAKPLFFLDYFGTGKLASEVAADVVSGIARGCKASGCALVGGETAELPGLYAEGEYDLAGFCVGLLDRSKILDGSAVRPGDAVVGVLSEGLHSNGLSLAQKVLVDHAGLSFSDTLEGLEGSLGQELLRPTALYPRLVQGLMKAGLPKALAHITGGGLPGNLPRVLPAGTQAVLDRSTWARPVIFDHIQRRGPVATAEMYRTFNMGVGMCVVCADADVPDVLAAARAEGFEAARIGHIQPGADAPSVAWADEGGAA